jgi:hypothetical protein
MYKRAVWILTAYDQTIPQNVAIDLLLKEEKFCEKATTKTSCCYELMKFFIVN